MADEQDATLYANRNLADYTGSEMLLGSETDLAGAPGLNFSVQHFMRFAASGYIERPSTIFNSPNNYDGNVGVKNTLREWRMGMLGSPGWERWSLYDATGAAERISVLPSGYVGIGTVAPGHQLDVNGSARVSNSFIAKNGALSAIISVGGGSTAYFGTDSNHNLGILTNNGVRMTIDVTGNVTPGVDNAQAFGWSSARWSVIYAATGTINTSDEREKSWLQSGIIASDGNRISANIDDDAFYRAGLAIINEFGFYQWLDAIDEKGTAKGADGARIHFGPRAQRVFAAFQAEGIEPARLAMCCYDEWADKFEPIFETRTVKAKELRPNPKFNPDKKEGKRNQRETMQSVEVDEQYDTGEKKKTLEAGNRYGLRLDMLNSFLGSVRDRRQDELDARIAKLEASAVDGAAAV